MELYCRLTLDFGIALYRIGGRLRSQDASLGGVNLGIPLLYAEFLTMVP